jgi:hypothetical protein
MHYRGLAGLAFVLWVAAGCASTNKDDAPPWQRPGLANGKIGQAIAKAARDNDEQMSMTSDRELTTSDFVKNHGD